jgi:hypothetical protein
MVQRQSTLTGHAVTFSARTSLLQSQRNCSFSRTAVNQSFFDRHKGRKVSGPYFTIKNLWQALWNISWNNTIKDSMHGTLRQNTIKNLWLALWNISWDNIIKDSMHGTLRQNFNQISKGMDQDRLHTRAAV